MPFSIYLCFFIFLISCDNSKDMGIPEFQNDTFDITPGDISDRLIARICFDATLSMQGFVVPRSTRYTQMCPYLESVIVSGWRDGKVDFFRFGEQVESIDRGTYLKAGSVDFYDDKNINRETFIQKIIDYEDQLDGGQMEASKISEASTEEVNESRKENRLVVIVTDLFQDNSDINLLVNQLKGKIKNGFEVGLFGLRSQFDGTVYDTGIGEAPMPYQSDPKDPETFRPFYLLVLGRYADIAHYFDRLKANNPDAKTIIFSRYLVSPLLSFDGAKIKTEIKTENLNRKTESQDPRLEQYEIVDNSKDATISAKLEYVLLPHVMPFDSDTLEVSIIAKHAPMGETKISPEAKGCLKVKSKLSKNEDGNELSVDFSLDSRSLPGKAVYLYEVTLHPGIDTYRAPDWCSAWDMGGERNGSKTLNLVNFVRDLSLVTAQEHHPKIAKFYCYIGKR